MPSEVGKPNCSGRLYGITTQVSSITRLTPAIFNSKYNVFCLAVVIPWVLSSYRKANPNKKPKRNNPLGFYLS